MTTDTDRPSFPFIRVQICQIHTRITHGETINPKRNLISKSHRKKRLDAKDKLRGLSPRANYMQRITTENDSKRAIR